MDDVLEMDENTYTKKRKEMANRLKAFEKRFVKHVKGTHVELNKIIYTCMNPLILLLESNLNFHKVEELIKKK